MSFNVFYRVRLLPNHTPQVKDQLEAAGIDTSFKGGAKLEDKEKAAGEVEKERKADDPPKGDEADGKEDQEPKPATPEPTTEQIEMVTGLGFPTAVALFALKKFGSVDNGPAFYDVQRAVDYLLSNGEDSTHY